AASHLLLHLILKLVSSPFSYKTLPSTTAALPSLNPQHNTECGFSHQSMAAISAAAAVSCSSLNSSMRRMPRVTYMKGMNSFSGLKANNNVSSLGLPACTAASFAKVLRSLRAPPKGKTESRGGAFSSTCNAAEEIFRIAAIMNGLVLVGVAVGFVLLRVEAWVEESES
ncbi:hypothetical protein GW17_00048783, partial [Ensete ventricosum]